MLHQTFLFLGQLWQLFEVSQILEFLRYTVMLLNIGTDRFDQRVHTQASVYTICHSIASFWRLMACKIKQQLC